MAEPARKPEDETQPYLRSIPDGGNTTPGKSGLKLVDNQNSGDDRPDELAARRKLNERESNPHVSDNDETIANQEANTDDPFINNVTGKKDDNKKTKGKFSFLKKKGPAGFIVTVVLGGGVGIATLFSPGLLIINLKEVMVSKFNTQLTSMDVRTNKVLKSKLVGNVDTCGSVIKCKFSTISDNQIKKLKSAGIEVITDVDASKTLVSRSFVFEGKTIKSIDLDSALSANVGFRSAVKKAYNPKFAGFADSIWNKAAFTIKITKKPTSIDGDTDAEKLKSIQAETKNAAGAVSANKPTIGAEKPDGSGPYTQQDIDDFNKKLASAVDDTTGVASDITKQADDISKTGKKAFSKAAQETAESLKTVVKGATSSLKITGWIDNLCTAYGTVRAIGFAAKTVRAVQLARYAMLFFKIADQMKAGGNPDPKDVAYLGAVLTADVVSTVTLNGGVTNMVRKSGTDSFGYKYAAYGETGPMSTLSSQFLAGGGLTGTLIGFTSELNNALGKSPQTTCKINNNVFVSIGSGIIGIIAAVASGGISISIGAIVSTTISVGVMFLPALLKDIVAGVVVDETTIGEASVDAITSGGSKLMGEVAATGSNAPLTVAEAMEYRNLSNNIAANYAEEDRLAYSPLDISNRNTFMGSLFSKITPYLANMSSLSGSLSSMSSLVSNSLSSVLPVTKAADAGEYEICQDTDYQALDLAADPYCNLVYGIPTDILQNIEPMDVLNKMTGQIDETTGLPKSGSNYEKFVNDCINRTEPIGYTGSSFDVNNGEACLINNEHPDNQYYYLYQIDQRVQKGMDGEDETLNLAMETGLNSDISFYDGSNGINSNIAKTSTAKTKTVTNIQPANLSSILNLPGFNFTNNKSYGL